MSTQTTLPPSPPDAPALVQPGSRCAKTVETPRQDGLALDRRTFLAWSAAAAAAPWLLEPAARPAVAATEATIPTLPLSVGYVEGSDAWARLERVAPRLQRGQAGEPGREERLRVVPAEALIAGDQTLAAETVRLKVHGLYPTDLERRGGLGAAYLTVLFPSFDPQVEGPFPFFAWSVTTVPGVNRSAPLSFVVPLGIDGSLRLVLDVAPGTRPYLATRRGVLNGSEPATITAARYLTDFTVDWQPGRPKLQRGTYLLALAPDTWAGERDLPATGERRQQPRLASLVVTVERAAIAETE